MTAWARAQAEGEPTAATSTSLFDYMQRGAKGRGKVDAQAQSKPVWGAQAEPSAAPVAAAAPGGARGGPYKRERGARTGGKNDAVAPS